jgi:hypothetical protein
MMIENALIMITLSVSGLGEQERDASRKIRPLASAGTVVPVG